MNASDTPGTHIYNLGTGHGTSVYEIIKTYESISGKPLARHVAPRRPGDLPAFYADPSRAAPDLGWSAHLTVPDAMKDTLHYLASFE